MGIVTVKDAIFSYLGLSSPPPQTPASCFLPEITIPTSGIIKNIFVQRNISDNLFKSKLKPNFADMRWPLIEPEWSEEGAAGLTCDEFNALGRLDEKLRTEIWVEATTSAVANALDLPLDLVKMIAAYLPHPFFVKEFSWEEIRQHSSISDCWLVIHGHVFNVTPFLPAHPGGLDLLHDRAGKDASREFEEVCHSKWAWSTAQKYVIGSVK